MKFSIIIPVYKVEDYLEDCVNSVLFQSFKDYEIILVDDGSPDSCPEICDRFASMDSRIIVIHKKNGGLSSARNEGIAVAKGEYIIFLDSDDCWIDVCALEKINHNIEENTEVIVWKFIKIPEEYKYYPLRRNRNYNKDVLKINDKLIDEIKKGAIYGCAWNLAIKRSLFLSNNLFFEIGYVSEDLEWYVRLLLAINKITIIDLIVNGYRRRKSSISNTVNIKTIKHLNHHYGNIESHLKKAPSEKHNIIKVYLGEQIANYCIALSTLNSNNFEKYFSSSHKKYLKYCKRRRSRIIYNSVLILGLPMTLKLLRIMKKIV